MCKAVEEYAAARAEESALSTKIEILNNLMENFRMSFDQAADAVGLTDKEKTMIAAQLQ